MERSANERSVDGRSNQECGEQYSGGKRFDGSSVGGDLEVDAVEITKNQQVENTFYNGFGGGRRFGGGFGYATTTEDTYKVGTLLINLFDAKAEKLIWRGSSGVTASNNPTQNTKNHDKSVEKMFQHFPPNPPKT